MSMAFPGRARRKSTDPKEHKEDIEEQSVSAAIPSSFHPELQMTDYIFYCVEKIHPFFMSIFSRLEAIPSSVLPEEDLVNYQKVFSSLIQEKERLSGMFKGLYTERDPLLREKISQDDAIQTFRNQCAMHIRRLLSRLETIYSTLLTMQKKRTSFSTSPFLKTKGGGLSPGTALKLEIDKSLTNVREPIESALLFLTKVATGSYNGYGTESRKIESLMTALQNKNNPIYLQLLLIRFAQDVKNEKLFSRRHSDTPKPTPSMGKISEPARRASVDGHEVKGGLDFSDFPTELKRPLLGK